MAYRLILPALLILLASLALILSATPAAAMPPVVAALGAAAGGWMAGLTATAIMGQAALAAVLTGIQMAMAKKPKAKTRDEITLNRIQPVTTGRILYGERMLGGSIVARATTEAGGKPHRRYHSIMPLACHEIDGAVEIWLGETLVWTEAQYRRDVAAGSGDPDHWGQVGSDYKGRVRLRVHNGGEDQAAEARYVAAAREWTEAHRLRGVAYVYFEADYDRDLFPSGAPQIRVRCRGKRVLDPREWTSSALASATAASTVPNWAGTDDGAIGQVGGGGYPKGETATPWTGGAIAARFYFGRRYPGGLDPEAGLSPDLTATRGEILEASRMERGADLFAAFDVAFPDAPEGVIWEQGGAVYGAYLGVTGSDLVFRAFSGEASGPKLARATLPVSAVAGRRGTIYVEIDRTTGTVALWFKGRRYSTNPALCLRDYMLTPQLRGGPGWRPGDLDEDTILALANLAEEQVPLASGATEDRYAFNGVLETEATAAENLNDLSSSWGGWWTCERGRLTVGGAAWEEPAFTVTEDMLVGGIQVTARKPFEEQFNTVKAQYADPENEHVVTDLPVLDSATYIAADNGEPLVLDMGELPGETGFARGQRLMKLALLKGRRQKQVTLPCSLAAWPVRLGDNIRVSLPRRGWTAKTFEVTGRTVHIGEDGVRVTLSCIETGPAIFDWRTSEETPKPAGGVPTLPSPTAKPVVSAPTMTEELYETRGGGGVKTRVRLAATTDNPFVDAWQFAWRPVSAPEPTLRALTDTPEDMIDDVAPGTYAFGVRGRNARGIWSDWAWAGAAAVQGENAPPGAITGLSVQASGGAVAMLRWDRHPSLDVRQGGRIEFRHAGAQAGASWQSSTGIGKSVSGGVTEATLPLKSGTYLARPYDAMGTPGPVSGIAVRAASIIPTTTVASLAEAPGFAGIATGCSAAGGVLAMAPGEARARYAFAGRIDLGAVQPVRLISDIELLISEARDLFWQPSGTAMWTPPDARLWLGSTDAYGDVDLQVSVTDDAPDTDPAAARWGPWQSFDAADFSGRAFRFRAVLSVESPDYTIGITGLTVTALQAA
ncbi:putative prophage-associated protein [Rhodovulum sulfidophilum]|uniref:Putative prophage-associated protein n=1 Tax=Rhodovulum sulfidophilum TaxID=35806 RepID=A0A0D6B2W4_RHOSU|nr:putative prophage-associated protein [Rhodovulum sulfidophilum]